MSAFQPYSQPRTIGSATYDQEADQGTAAGVYTLATAGASMAPAHAYAGQAQLAPAAAETTPVCCCQPLGQAANLFSGTYASVLAVHGSHCADSNALCLCAEAGGEPDVAQQLGSYTRLVVRA